MMRKRSIRGPSAARIAGSTTIEASAENATTAMPAYAKDCRYGTGNTSSADIEIITVIALNATVRPAVWSDRPMATAVPAPVSSSSR